MQKAFLKFLLIFLVTGCSLSRVNPKADIYQPMLFSAQSGPGKFDSYLQMNINFDPLKKLYLDLDRDLGNSLNKKNARTEAHITVITPVEYRNILEPAGISIDKINEIAEKMKIQRSEFEVICLGKAENFEKSTYFLVIESEDLFNIRRAIFQEYVKYGGKPSRWDPELYYPHITVGYTHRDLHLEIDGVFKGLNSCWRKVDI